MVDYSKLKVTELKEELKKRNVPLKGLKLKQDFVDKLVELDAAAVPEPEPPAPAPAPGQEDQDMTPNEPAQEQMQLSAGDQAVAAESGSRKSVEPTIAPEETPASQTEPEPAKDEVEAKQGNEDKIRSEQLVDKSESFAQQSAAQEVETKHQVSRTSIVTSRLPSVAASEQTSEQIDSPAQPDTQFPATTEYSIIVSTQELLEDTKKRKRRSATPPPMTQEMMLKKYKGVDGSPRVAPREDSLVESQDVLREASAKTSGLRTEHGVSNGDTAVETQQQTEQEGVTRKPSTDPPSPEAPSRVDSFNKPRSPRSPRTNRPISLTQNLLRRSPSPSKPQVDSDRSVSPALHPATSSLYIRNFKRPLNIPELRSHIERLIQPPSASPSADSSPSIKIFHIDTVKSHAFITFTNSTAAARVRSRLHASFFPDKTREALWVDFLPDASVPAFIDTESRTVPGNRIAIRWEVNYVTNSNGTVEAQLIDPSQSQASRSNSLRQASASSNNADPLTLRNPSAASAVSLAPEPKSATSSVPTSATVPGIHPDRMRLVPQSPPHRLSSGFSNASTAKPHAPPPSRLQSNVSQQTAGSGFRALDDLFASTTAKPKLYFKPVGEKTVQHRRGLLERLEKNWGGARSGDDGMKRYTLERDGEGARARDDWVDKGPEFGYRRQRPMGRGRGGYAGGRDRDRDRDGPGGYAGYGAGGGGGGGGGGYGAGFRGGRGTADTWRRY